MRQFLRLGDITPEFSGRAMRPKGTIAAPEAEMTVMPVHFIEPGPAATRCYTSGRGT
jgi:hypothetical protein